MKVPVPVIIKLASTRLLWLRLAFVRSSFLFVIVKLFCFLKRTSFPPPLEMSCDTLDCFAFRVCCSLFIAEYWPRCRYSPAYCVTAVFFNSGYKIETASPHKLTVTKTAVNWVLPKDSINSVFLDSPFGCRCLTLDLNVLSVLPITALAVARAPPTAQPQCSSTQ